MLTFISRFNRRRRPSILKSRNVFIREVYNNHFATNVLLYFYRKDVKTESTSSQDSSVLNTLATLATATFHHTTCIPTTPTNSMAMAMPTVSKQGVTLAPLTIPPTTHSASLLSNITPITPPMWAGNVAPLQSPLAALSAISALSQPAQHSPMNIPMHQLPFAVPVFSQSGGAQSNQLFLTQVPLGGQQAVTAPSAQSTVTVSSITGSGEIGLNVRLLNVIGRRGTFSAKCFFSPSG